MKMTMHIDDALLKEVMEATGAASKTAAVNEALRKIATKFRQREAFRKGLGMSSAEIKDSYDADLALGITPSSPMLLSETKVKYKTSHGRRSAR